MGLGSQNATVIKFGLYLISSNSKNTVCQWAPPPGLSALSIMSELKRVLIVDWSIILRQ